MAGLQLPFDELIREAREIEKIAGKKFLDKDTLWRLHEFIGTLERIKNDPERCCTCLELGELYTKTAPSYDGQARRVRLCFDGVWEICALGKKGVKRSVEFSGIASARLRFEDVKDRNRRLAMWKMELGAHNSPGCYFHMHLIRDSQDPKCPKSLPVPRLPSLFVTPMAALEYALGELFQNEWKKELERSNPSSAWWCERQRERLSRLLAWQQKLVNRARGSPWMYLRAAKPRSDCFLPAKRKNR